MGSAISKVFSVFSALLLFSILYSTQVFADPAVGITSPTSGAIFTSPANIKITANAIDPEGGISRVDFFYGYWPQTNATEDYDVHWGTIGSVTTCPYNITREFSIYNTYAGYERGSYCLKVVAYNNAGEHAESKWVYFDVKPRLAPTTVKISSPTTNQRFNPGSDITLTAVASSGKGISKVEFYQGLTLLETDTASPFSYVWRNVPQNNYTLTAKAWGNLGDFATSTPVNIKVFPALTSVALSGNPTSPTVINAKVLLKADPVGGGAPEYQFWVKNPGAAAKTLLRDYETGNSVIWTPTADGTHILLVYAREQGSKSPYQCYQTLVYTVMLPMTAVTLKGTPEPPITTGMKITLTAAPTGGASPEYQFWVRVPGSAAKSLLLDYASSNTCVWTPTVPGTYTLLVYAREKGSKAAYQVFSVVQYTVK